MWRLLPLCLLVACATNESHRSASGESGAGTHSRIIRTLELPLQPPALIIQGEPARWTFSDFNVSGWVDEDGYIFIAGRADDIIIRRR